MFEAGGRQPTTRRARRRAGRRALGRGLVALGLLLALPVAGCGLLSSTVAGTPGAAHVVTLTQAACPAFVVKTYNGRYAVLREAAPDYVPTLGDLLEGPPLQRGIEVLRYYPPSEVALRDGDFIPVEVQVDLPDVPLSEAQTAMRAVCGPPPEPAEASTPVPVVIAPDSLGPRP